MPAPVHACPPSQKPFQLLTADKHRQRPQLPHVLTPLRLQDTINHNLSHPECVRPSERWAAAKRSGTAHVLYHRTVTQAYVIAATVHGAATLPDGGRVMDCLEKTALTVADLGLDAVAVAAALLHQSLDDGELDEAVLRAFIGGDVAALVAGSAQATRLSRLYTQQPSLQDAVRTGLRPTSATGHSVRFAAPACQQLAREHAALHRPGMGDKVVCLVDLARMYRRTRRSCARRSSRWATRA